MNTAGKWRMLVLRLLWVCAPLVGWAQPMPPVTVGLQAPYTFARAGKLFVHWGYNRAGYTRSDLHMQGPGFGFTLENARAYDRPSRFNPEVYFNPSKLSIPQYNVRIGLFLTEHWAVSIGTDHMKYELRADQWVNVTGSVSADASAQYAGSYLNTPVQVKDNFVQFEHTDGLNFASAELEYHHQLWGLPNGNLGLEAVASGGVGLVIPRTDARIFNRGMNTYFHLAGVGASLQTGLRLYVLKHFFVQANVKGGYIGLPNIILHNDLQSTAQQYFGFLEGYAAFGGQFTLWK